MMNLKVLFKNKKRKRIPSTVEIKDFFDSKLGINDVGLLFNKTNQMIIMMVHNFIC